MAAPTDYTPINGRHPYAGAEEISAISDALRAARSAAGLNRDPMDMLGFIDLNHARQNNPAYMEVFKNALKQVAGQSAAEILAQERALGRGELSWLNEFRENNPLSQEAQASLANLYDQSINWDASQMPKPRPPQDPDVPSAGGIGGQPGQPGQPPVQTQPPATGGGDPFQPSGGGTTGGGTTGGGSSVQRPYDPFVPSVQPPAQQQPVQSAPPQQGGLMTNTFNPTFNNQQYGPNPSDAMFNPSSRANNFYTQQLRRQQQQRADMREANNGRDWSTGHLADPFTPSQSTTPTGGGGQPTGPTNNTPATQPPATQPPATQPPSTQPPTQDGGGGGFDDGGSGGAPDLQLNAGGNNALMMGSGATVRNMDGTMQDPFLPTTSPLGVPMGTNPQTGQPVYIAPPAGGVTPQLP